MKTKLTYPGNLKKIVNLWLPVVVWSLVIFSFSSHPTVKTSEIHWQDFIVKKSAHIIEYFILAVLLYRSFRGSGGSQRKSAISAVLLIFLFGASDEYHQSFTPGREPRFRDVVIDTFGALLAIFTVQKTLGHLPDKFKIPVETFLHPYKV